MTDLIDEDDAIAATAGLTRDRLMTFIAADVITPIRGAAGPVYRRIDIARLRLLCELSDDLELDEHALGIVMSLLDQLHDARAALLALADAFADDPDQSRVRIDAYLSRTDE